MKNIKKIRYIILVLIFFLMMLFMKNSKAYGLPAKEYSLPTLSNVNLGKNIGNVKYSDVVKENGDFYCIDHTGTLTDKLTSNYKIVGYIEIKGTTVKAYSAWESGSAAPGTTIENVEYAPYIAQLLYETGTYGKGYGTKTYANDRNAVTKAQYGVWKYWNTFLEQMDSNSENVSKSNYKSAWGGRGNPSSFSSQIALNNNIKKVNVYATTNPLNKKI